MFQRRRAQLKPKPASNGLPESRYRPSTSFPPINVVGESSYGDPPSMTGSSQSGLDSPYHLQPSPPMLESQCKTSQSQSPDTPQHSLLVALQNVNLTNGTATPVTPGRSISARQLKHNFNESSGRHRVGEQDPENREIYRLRQECHLEFHEIANILSRKRAKTGQKTKMTSNAVYSRYKRNGPLIAAADGKDFEPIDKDRKKSNGKELAFARPVKVVGFDEHEDRLLVQAVKDINDQRWELVAKRLQDLGGGVHDAEKCALRYDRI